MDLTGQRFGRLLVLNVYKVEKMNGKNHTYWRCKCDCGVEIAVRQANLTSSNTKSCGCIRNALSAERLRKYCEEHRRTKENDGHA